MKDSTAVIQFIGYRISNIEYICDAAFEFPEEERNYKFNFGKSCIPLSDSEIQENVSINVFWGTDNKDTAPYRLTIDLAGRFVCKERWDPGFEPNVLAILFPYLRALVSVITSNSGREPIVLPTVNIKRMFEINTDKVNDT